MKKKLLIALGGVVVLGAAAVLALRITSKNYQEDVRANIDGVTSDKSGEACGLDCEVDAGDHQSFGQNLSVQEVAALFDDKEDAVLMIGFDACPWCIDLSPVLSAVVEEMGLNDLAYYFNTRPDGLKDNDYRYGEDPDYLKLYERLLPFLEDDKTVYAPTVAFIKDGEVKGVHVGTLDGHDAHERDLNDEEIEELKAILKEDINHYLN